MSTTINWKIIDDDIIACIREFYVEPDGRQDSFTIGDSNTKECTFTRKSNSTDRQARTIQFIKNNLKNKNKIDFVGHVVNTYYEKVNSSCGHINDMYSKIYNSSTDHKIRDFVDKLYQIAKTYRYSDSKIDPVLFKKLEYAGLTPIVLMLFGEEFKNTPSSFKKTVMTFLVDVTDAIGSDDVATELYNKINVDYVKRFDIQQLINNSFTDGGKTIAFRINTFEQDFNKIITEVDKIKNSKIKTLADKISTENDNRQKDLLIQERDRVITKAKEEKNNFQQAARKILNQINAIRSPYNYINHIFIMLYHLIKNKKRDFRNNPDPVKEFNTPPPPNPADNTNTAKKDNVKKDNQGTDKSLKKTSDIDESYEVQQVIEFLIKNTLYQEFINYDQELITNIKYTFDFFGLSDVTNTNITIESIKIIFSKFIEIWNHINNVLSKESPVPNPSQPKTRKEIKERLIVALNTLINNILKPPKSLNIILYIKYIDNDSKKYTIKPFRPEMIDSPTSPPQSGNRIYYDPLTKIVEPSQAITDFFSAKTPAIPFFEKTVFHNYKKSMRNNPFYKPVFSLLGIYFDMENQNKNNIENNIFITVNSIIKPNNKLKMDGSTYTIVSSSVKSDNWYITANSRNTDTDFYLNLLKEYDMLFNKKFTPILQPPTEKKDTEKLAAKNVMKELRQLGALNLYTKINGFANKYGKDALNDAADKFVNDMIPYLKLSNGKNKLTAALGIIFGAILGTAAVGVGTAVVGVGTATLATSIGVKTGLGLGTAPITIPMMLISQYLKKATDALNKETEVSAVAAAVAAVMNMEKSKSPSTEIEDSSKKNEAEMTAVVAAAVAAVINSTPSSTPNPQHPPSSPQQKEEMAAVAAAVAAVMGLQNKSSSTIQSPLSPPQQKDEAEARAVAAAAVAAVINTTSPQQVAIKQQRFENFKRKAIDAINKAIQKTKNAAKRLQLQKFKEYVSKLTIFSSFKNINFSKGIPRIISYIYNKLSSIAKQGATQKPEDSNEYNDELKRFVNFYMSNDNNNKIQPLIAAGNFINKYKDNKFDDKIEKIIIEKLKKEKEKKEKEIDDELKQSENKPIFNINERNFHGTYYKHIGYNGDISNINNFMDDTETNKIREFCDNIDKKKITDDIRKKCKLLSDSKTRKHYHLNLSNSIPIDDIMKNLFEKKEEIEEINNILNKYNEITTTDNPMVTIGGASRRGRRHIYDEDDDYYRRPTPTNTASTTSAASPYMFDENFRITDSYNKIIQPSAASTDDNDLVYNIPVKVVLYKGELIGMDKYRVSCKKKTAKLHKFFGTTTPVYIKNKPTSATTKPTPPTISQTRRVRPR